MQVMMADDDVTEEEIQEFIDDAREELQMVDLGGGKKSTSEKNAEEDNAQGIENTAQISEGAASVSYTHLDVYKRQALALTAAAFFWASMAGLRMRR